MSQQHICKRLFLGNRPKPYAGKPWGTRDLEAKSWQIASSVKVGLNVSYSVKIICFSLQVSTEHWVNSGYFLWEGKQSIWQSCAQWDIFRGFPPSLSPPAQHTHWLCCIPSELLRCTGHHTPSVGWQHPLSCSGQHYNSMMNLCKTTSGGWVTQNGHSQANDPGISCFLCSLSFRDYFIHPPGSRCWYREDKARSVFAACWFIGSPAPQPQDHTKSTRQWMCAPARLLHQQRKSPHWQGMSRCCLMTFFLFQLLWFMLPSSLQLT